LVVSFVLLTSNISSRYFYDVDLEAEVSGDIICISASVGVEKAISDSRKIRVEYFLSSDLMNRSYTDLKARWLSHQLSLSYLFPL
ncbi:MAG: hypothetical protein RIE59_14290, partial [Imperialibacter sp.]